MAAQLGEAASRLVRVSARQHHAAIGGAVEINLAARHDPKSSRTGFGMVTWPLAVTVVRKGAPRNAWLARLLAGQPRLLVATALANNMARTIWALLTRKEDERDPAAAAA